MKEIMYHGLGVGERSHAHKLKWGQISVCILELCPQAAAWRGQPGKADTHRWPEMVVLACWA